MPLPQKPLTSGTVWARTLLFSILIFVAGSFYLFMRRGIFDLFVANKVFAVTALVLIGLSLALSGICYFWDFADSQIVYRKDLGLSGFAFGVVHVVLSVFFLPHRFPYPQWMQEHWVSALAGLAALVIFAMMAAISNRFSIAALGVRRWRLLLRTGYVAYIFVIIHFAVLKYREWIRWIETMDPWLPPLSLLAFIFAVLVIVLRIALWIDQTRRTFSH